ncbi:hypothetical protein HBH75_149900 [Parastagonospora nodorum]|nr:hypothetical protein HBH75_149900 [Parastagonospora nodorum]
MKARQNHVDCLDQLRRYKIRVDSCEARRKTLLEKCQGFSLSANSDTEGIMEDVVNLRERMTKELQSYDITQTELEDWQQKRTIPDKIKWQLKEHPTKYFRSIKYAIYHRNIIEDWITGMEKSVEALEKLFQSELELQTAGHLKTLSQDNVLNLEGVKRFVKSLSRLATTLYKGTVTSVETASAYDWALELAPSVALADVEEWDFAQVTLALSFSGPGLQQQKQQFKIQACHQVSETTDSVTRWQVEQIVKNNIKGVSGPPIEGLLCVVQQDHGRRTRPLGELFVKNPHLFRDVAWRPDRMSLILGIVKWALLLWDTEWMKHLCSYGLHIEKIPIERVATKDPITEGTIVDASHEYAPTDDKALGEDAKMNASTQVFVLNECSNYDCRNSSLKLRNIGLVLAEMVLAVPLRSRSESAGIVEAPSYEQFVNGHWKNISSTKIKTDVRMKTMSIPFANAVGFCLTDVSKLGKAPFQAGFLFRYIEKIYKP